MNPKIETFGQRGEVYDAWCLEHERYAHALETGDKTTVGASILLHQAEHPGPGQFKVVVFRFNTLDQALQFGEALTKHPSDGSNPRNDLVTVYQASVTGR